MTDRRGWPFQWGARTFVMGIVNLSPDSFSGDAVGSADEAVARALAHVRDGADIVDVGGESTRPGAAPVSLEQEMLRVLPAIRAIREVSDLPLSVDTSKAAVARAALDAGADVINDVSGLTADPAMTRLVAEMGAGVVIVHHQRVPPEGLLMGEILAELDRAVEAAVDAGIDRSKIVVDPGFGFKKTRQQNLALLGNLSVLRALELPVLVGTSRKGTIAKLLGRPPGDVLAGTLASVALSVAGGVDMVRVHDVLPAVQAVQVADAVVRA